MDKNYTIVRDYNSKQQAEITSLKATNERLVGIIGDLMEYVDYQDDCRCGRCQIYRKAGSELASTGREG